MIRVLIVEDSEEKLSSIKTVLHHAGISNENIDCRFCVRDALIELKNTQYDVLILDLMLPVRSPTALPRNDAGVDILRKLNTHELIIPATVIGLTAHESLKNDYEGEFQAFDFNIYNVESSDRWMDVLESKIMWIAKKKNNPKPVLGKRIIITIHGINSAGNWQKTLETNFPKSDNVVFKHYKYIHKSPLKILVPFWRNKNILRFVSDLKTLMREYPDAEYFFFAHSFGTLLLMEGLKKIPSINLPKIKLIALAGSVLKREFDWGSLTSEIAIERVVNDCGVSDWALPFAHVFAQGLGMSGRTGFYGFSDSIVVNRFFKGGHSFFEESESFYQDYWITLISASNEVPRSSDAKHDSKVEAILDNAKNTFLLLGIVVAGTSLAFWYGW